VASRIIHDCLEQTGRYASATVARNSISSASPVVRRVRIPSRPATLEPQQNCHPSYILRLAPGSGDYDCRAGRGNSPNCTGRRRSVAPDDFDRDRNGIGCE